MLRVFAGVALLALAGTPHGQPTSAELDRVDAAIRAAFDYLYTLPSDTAAARMGTWVLDSAPASAAPAARDGRWKIVVTKLVDTGQSLKLSEMVGSSGTSPAQLAAAMAAMQRLEGKISKAETEAAIEINIAINGPEIALTGVSDEAQRSKPAIAGAELSVRVHGDWMRLDDRDLEIDYDRWSPATLLVGFGGFAPVETRRLQPKESLSSFTAVARPVAGGRSIHTLAVTAQGNEEMLDRVVHETRWELLAALVR